MKLAAAACLSLLLAGRLSYSVAAMPSPARAPRGLKVTVRETTTGPARHEPQVVVVTRYIRSDRSRFELTDLPPGVTRPRFASITRCDLHEFFYLDLDQHQYDWMPLRPTPRGADWATYAAWWGGTRQPVAARPTVLIELITRDTGERQMMFGRSARRVVMTRKQTPIAAPASSVSEQTIDGWYIDLDTGTSCEPSAKAMAFATTITDVTHGGALPYYTFKRTGPLETGFMVAGRASGRSRAVTLDGLRTAYEWTSETAVTDLAEGPLPDSLFQIPRGFRERPMSLAERWNRYWDALKGTVWRWFY